MLYYTNVDQSGLHDMLIGATSFFDERHLGDAIRRQTVANLESVGLTFDDIHAKVLDQRSSIKKAWGRLLGG